MSQAIILIGGLGTRLRALYPDRPKCLVPILGKPYLARLFERLAAADIRDIHLACGYRAGDVATWLGRRDGVTLSVEPEPLGTGGGLKFVEPHLRSDPFWVLNGDSFLPGLDFAAMESASRRDATLAVTPIERAGRFGSVEHDADGRITAFREKADRASGWVNGGVYFMTRRALADIPAGRAVSLETETFPALAAAGRLTAFAAPPPLLDIGTPEGIAETEAFFQSLEKNSG